MQRHVVTSQFVMFTSCAFNTRADRSWTWSRHVIGPEDVQYSSSGVCVKAGLWTLDWTHGLDHGPIFGPSSGPSFGPTELHNDYSHSELVI